MFVVLKRRYQEQTVTKKDQMFRAGKNRCNLAFNEYDCYQSKFTEASKTKIVFHVLSKNELGQGKMTRKWNWKVFTCFHS